MKSKIFKLSSLLLAVISLFLLSITNAYAASSYDIASYITFSSDMNIDEGFDLIKPFMLYQNGQPCTSNYTFNYESLGNNRYQYTGTYPDGSTFSKQVSIFIIEDASGTYVSALMTQNYYRQSIYVKDLKEGKTTNDCLLECWKDRFVCIKEPTYSIYDQPTQNIYTRMTSFENAAGTHQLMYYAVIENVNYTPDEDQSDNATNNDTTTGDTTTGDTSGDNDSSLYEPIIPDDGTNDNTPSDDTGNTDDNSSSNDNSNGGSSNTPNDSNNNSSNNNNSTNDAETEKDPLLIALFCAGGILGLVLIFLLYKIIKSVFIWLKR